MQAQFTTSKYENFSFPIKSSAMAYDHIKKLMKLAGEEQSDLARLLGRSPAVITNLFKGERSLQIEEVQKIAAHYKVSTDYVIYGKEDVSIRPVESAIIYAIKDILKIITKEKPGTKQKLREDFMRALDLFHEAPGAVKVMDSLLACIEGPSLQERQPIGDKLLRLDPPG